jgi:hypothetical protein
MIKTDPNLITYLEQNALWLIVHPVYTFDKEIHEIYPWLRSETINFSRKINYYVKDVTHRAISAPSDPIRFFNNYLNIIKFENLVKYMTENNLTNIVYCGFHYGYCIINDKDIGLNITSKYYNCYVKHDLCQISWEADWDRCDKKTLQFAKII